MRWLWSAAIIAALAAPGCGATYAATDDDWPAGVVRYESGSRGEARLQSRLLASDDQARGPIAEARDALNKAYAAFYATAKRYGRRKDGDGGPTLEQVGALRKEAVRTYTRYRDLIWAQREEYEEFLQRYQDNWYARHRYAWFLADHQMRHEAAAEWRRVIETEPRYPYPYNNLASLYNHMGRDTEAMDLLRKAIEIYDKDPVFHINLAVNYSAHRNEAMERYGWDLPRTFRECISEYRKACDLAPGNVEYARETARQYVLAKFFNVPDTADDAIAAWKRYLTLDLTPIQRATGLRSIGRITLMQKKDAVGAREWLEKSVKLFDEPTARDLLKRAGGAQDEGAPASGSKP